MEEVRIYRIVWKNILAAIVCLALTAFGIIEAINTNEGAGKATVGLFFGFIGLFALYQTVKVRRRPYLTITDKCLIESRTDRSLPDYTIQKYTFSRTADTGSAVKLPEQGKNSSGQPRWRR